VKVFGETDTEIEIVLEPMLNIDRDVAGKRSRLSLVFQSNVPISEITGCLLTHNTNSTPLSNTIEKGR